MLWFEVCRAVEWWRNPHCVLDTIGGETQERSFKVLRKGGVLVSIVSQPSAESAAANGVRKAYIFMQPNQTLNTLKPLVTISIV